MLTITKQGGFVVDVDSLNVIVTKPVNKMNIKVSFNSKYFWHFYVVIMRIRGFESSPVSPLSLRTVTLKRIIGLHFPFNQVK